MHSIVGIDGDGSVSSDITCCVNRNGNPRAGLICCILEIIIGIIKVGNVLVSIRINGDGSPISHITR